ncbi:MAG: helicase-related protein, partial [Ignavibacterium sp.]|nr:helicase-related protein [Ignavibacterium sp.]
EKCNTNEKFTALIKILERISREFEVDEVEELFTNNGFGAGLIFCPHVNSTDFSVAQLNKKLGEYFSLRVIGVEKESKLEESPNCPRCNAPMKLRTNRYDQSKFWGCSRFPECRGSLNYNPNKEHQRFDYEIKHFESIGMFAGGMIKGFTPDRWNQYKQDIQLKFIKDEIACMVTTKSFGMGIDKPNIRYTIHYNLPQSIESFYQEAGRAGRDGNKAICSIIFSDDNPQLDAPFLDISKKADEIWEIKNNSNSDISRNLYFQEAAYIGEKLELEKIIELLNQFIYPKLLNLGEFEQAKLTVPDAEINEKFLFRLKPFGLITDYVIEYKSDYYGKINSIMNITIQKLKLNQYVSNLINHFKVRRENQIATKIYEEVKYINFTSLKDEIEYCIKNIIKFVYEKIEPQRRASLRNMVDACRSSTVEEFRRKVLRYLSPDEEINFEFSVFPNSQNFEDWINIIKNAIESDQVDKFLGVTLRIIESYPQEPGLLYISFALRMLLPNEDKQLIENELRAFVRFYTEANYNDDLETALVKVFEILLRKSRRDDIFIDILSFATKHISKTNLIKLAFVETPLSKTKVFLLTILLKSINEKLKVKQINLGKYERSK